jgi:transposase, IS5 family
MAFTFSLLTDMRLARPRYLGTTADLGKAAFRTRTRSARRLVQRLHRLARRKGDEAAQAMRLAYRRLIAVATKARRQAAQVGAALQG